MIRDHFKSPYSNMGNRVKLLCIVSGIFDATSGKAPLMNEMLLYAGFMNGVTSLFVPNLCSGQDNKVSEALAPPTKNVGLMVYIKIFHRLFKLANYLNNPLCHPRCGC